jgi:steroid delta-isomerase-like uncharacterized protein
MSRNEEVEMKRDPKEVIRAFFADQDRLHGGPSPELCADGYTATLGSLPPMDLAGHSDFAGAFYSAFGDLEHRVEDVIAENGRVAARVTIAGTHTGQFMDLPATGARVAVPAIVFLTIQEGKVAELHGQFDSAAFRDQLVFAEP